MQTTWDALNRLYGQLNLKAKIDEDEQVLNQLLLGGNGKDRGSAQDEKKNYRITWEKDKSGDYHCKVVRKGMTSLFTATLDSMTKKLRINRYQLKAGRATMDWRSKWKGEWTGTLDYRHGDGVHERLSFTDGKADETRLVYVNLPENHYLFAHVAKNGQVSSCDRGRMGKKLLDTSVGHLRDLGDSIKDYGGLYNFLLREKTSKEEEAKKKNAKPQAAEPQKQQDAEWLTPKDAGMLLSSEATKLVGALASMEAATKALQARSRGSHEAAPGQGIRAFYEKGLEALKNISQVFARIKTPQDSKERKDLRHTLGKWRQGLHGWASTVKQHDDNQWKLLAKCDPKTQEELKGLHERHDEQLVKAYRALQSQLDEKLSEMAKEQKQQPVKMAATPQAGGYAGSLTPIQSPVKGKVLVAKVNK